MCEPTSIAMGIAAVGSAAAQGSAARKAAKTAGRNAERLAIYQNERFQQAVEYQNELSEWQHETYKRTAESAQSSLTGQYSAMLDRVNQQRDRALEQAAMYDATNQAGAASLRARAAGETTGNSILLAQQAYEAASARQKAQIYKNLDAQMRQAGRQMAAMQAQAQGRVNAAMPAPLAPVDPAAPVAHVHQPSMAPYIMQGVSGIVGAAAHYQSIQSPSINPTTPTATTTTTGPITGGLPPGYTPNFNPGFSGY